jgi:hypothetical protein
MLTPHEHRLAVSHRGACPGARPLGIHDNDDHLDSDAGMPSCFMGLPERQPSSVGEEGALLLRQGEHIEGVRFLPDAES